MNFENLTPEQIEKANACKSPDELIGLAKAEGVELTDEQIEQISGGGVWNKPQNCPACGGGTIYHYGTEFHCKDCGHVWTEGGW